MKKKINNEIINAFKFAKKSKNPIYSEYLKLGLNK